MIQRLLGTKLALVFRSHQSLSTRHPESRASFLPDMVCKSYTAVAGVTEAGGSGSQAPRMLECDARWCQHVGLLHNFRLQTLGP